MMTVSGNVSAVWRGLLAAGLLLILTAPGGFAQSLLDEGPTAPARPSDSSVLQRPAEDEASSASTGIPAEQLIQVLRNDPEVMVEVKSVIADEAQQQDVSVQPDAISDQQVYSQLEASSALRARVTEFLRARGYLSETEIEDAHWRSAGRDAESGASHPAPLSWNQSLQASAGTGESELLHPSTHRSHGDSAGFGTPASSTLPPDTLSNTDNAANVTDAPSALHRPAPYNLRSLRDLYTQVPDSPEHLKRFGAGLFTLRGAGRATSFENAPDNVGSSLDVPLGPDYVVGAGDQLSITLWGGVSQTILRIVDREGRVPLPDAGPVQIAGLTLEQAQSLISGELQRQFRDAHVHVTVVQPRSIRIFVVGDVQRPGAYQLSALASPVTALFAAGGPTAVGSLRLLRHYRNQQLIGEIDLYDFMLRGVRPTDDRLQAGDTLLVPPVGQQIAVFGAVKRPAVYELKGETNLAEVLQDAGGLTVAASVANITIERVVANQHREQVAVDPDPDRDGRTISLRFRSTDVRDGDRIHVGTVLPYSEQVVYLQGHVARPGKFAFHPGMHIAELLRTYQDLLPEPADRGEIVRLVPPDLHPETIEFELPQVLLGDSDLALQPFDTVRIYSRYERDAPMVSVRGEVERPGTYPMFQGMTAAELVRTAGGFKRDALVTQADLASYKVENGARVVVERQDVAIGDAVSKGEHAADIPLKPGDVLTVHQLTGWNDIGASILISGEVAHPGSYSFEAGEHLSDVLRRAGGFRPTAYPEGAVLTRPEVTALEEKSRQELIRQIEAGAASARISKGGAGSEQAATMQVVQQQQEQILAQLREQPVTGRLVIHIDSDMDRWAGTPADLEVRSGDKLVIPKRPGFVLVSGQVYNPAAITFVPGHTARWYLNRAGGATSVANQKEIFIVRANGSVIGHGEQGLFERGVLSTQLTPGDTIVVPQKIIGPSITWRNLLITAQVVTSIAIAASVAGL